MIEETWKIASPIKFPSQFDVVNSCVASTGVSLSDKKTLYDIYNTVSKFTTYRQFLDALPNFKGKLTTSIYDCFV
jgi:hypothetical protein